MRARAAWRRSITAFWNALPQRPGRTRTVAGGRRDGPIDVLPRQEAAVVEGSGIAEVARRAHLPIEFQILPVVQRGQGFARLGVEGDLRARVAIEFENEALALAGYGRRFDDAARRESPLRVRWHRSWAAGPRRVHARIERAGEEHPEEAADAREHARSAPQRQAARGSRRRRWPRVIRIVQAVQTGRPGCPKQGQPGDPAVDASPAKRDCNSVQYIRIDTWA